MVEELGTTEQGHGCGYLQGKGQTRVDEVAEKIKLNGQPWIVRFTVHAGLLAGLDSIGYLGKPAPATSPPHLALSTGHGTEWLIIASDVDSSGTKTETKGCLGLPRFSAPLHVF